MSKKRKINLPVPEFTGNLPDENRQEIKSLISYINNVLLIRVDEMAQEIECLKKRVTPTFNLEMDSSDDEKSVK